MDAPRLSIYEFGEQLIRTGDLDPVYIAIVGARLEKPQLQRLLLSYLCFYHLGAAAYMSEQSNTGDPGYSDYWEAMMNAARNTNMSPLGGRWPRASERRHFRGAKCISAMQWMQERGVSALMDPIWTGGSAMQVMAQIGKWPMFGPWGTWKLADLLERCAGVPIEFESELAMLYKEPRAAMELLDPPLAPETHYQRLVEYFNCYSEAPPFNAIRRRSCNTQEAESISCKWRSYTHGHYFVGKDIHEVRQALKGWGPTADRLLASMPEEVICPRLS